MTYNPDGTSERELEKDLYEAAMTDTPRVFFGTISFNLWECVLIKGQGKVAYDPVAHAGRRTSIVVEWTIKPLDPTKPFIQPLGSPPLDWSPRFKGVLRPSIEALAADIARIKGLQVGQFKLLKAIQGMYVGGEFVPRPENEAGQTWTCPQIMAVYASREECEAAQAERLAELGINNTLPANEQPASTASGENNQRAAMAAFLPALWKQAQGSPTPLSEMDKLIRANPMLAMFNLGSPEVVALTGSEDPADDYEKELPF